jgi:hypothetical protein
MKRAEIVALSRAAVQRLSANKVGIIGMTKKQSEKLAEQKRNRLERNKISTLRHRTTSSPAPVEAMQKKAAKLAAFFA